VVDLLSSHDEVVEEVVEVQQLVDRLTSVTDVLRTGGVVVLVVVGFVVLFIIVNTIRLAVVARREEIEIMRLVGASDAFIRWPFIFEGAFVGLLGAGVTILILALAAGPVGEMMFGFFRVLPLELGTLARDIVLLVVGTGLGVGVMGSWLSVRSYLAR
jgi:cell division transport system permease protein